MKNDLTGIICAMSLEMEGLRERMTDMTSETVSGIEFVRGRIGGAAVVTAVCGVGKVFAALCARDFVVLAKGAAQVAAAKKYRSAALFKGNARLFKGVKIVFCNA